MENYYLRVESADGYFLQGVEFSMKTEKAALCKARKEACEIFSNVGYARYARGFAKLWKADRRNEKPIARWTLERKIEITLDIP